MKPHRLVTGALFVLSAAAAIAFLPLAPVRAHCDGLDGPVVQAAQEALAKNDVNLALIWVQKNDEPEIRRAFEQTVAVRKLSPRAKELADMYFFETLVRIHRAGEGAPYTGLKPAGRDLGPAIPAADQALRTANIAPLISLLTERMRSGITEKYERALAARSFKPQDLGAGREYIRAYVMYVHFVEGVYNAATTAAAGHYPEGPAPSHEDK